MVSFEDDDDAANNSGSDFQDDDEQMDDADGDEGDMDATMADEGDEDEDPDADEGDDDDDADPPDSPSTRHPRLSPKPTSNTTPATASGKPTVTLTSPSPRPSSRRHHPSLPSVRPEALTCGTYDIIPTMAAPQSTSINCVAATPDTRWVLSGGSDGYVRMYNWVDTANGKVPLTVAQKHPFVDSVMKAGSLTTYWENEEVSLRTPPNQVGEGGGEGKETSPCYALAVQREALWALSGLESGGINVVTCRHQAGTRITTLREHGSAVSVLKLNAEENGVLSGSWDKRVLDWDLNTGRVKRVFPGSGAQISALEVRPAGGMAVPKLEDVRVEEVGSGTFSSNNDHPVVNGADDGEPLSERRKSRVGNGEDAVGSPDGSLFGENDHGSLFGDGDDGGGGGGGGGGFGEDDDEFGNAMADGLQAEEENAAVPATKSEMADVNGASVPDVDASDPPADLQPISNGATEPGSDAVEEGPAQASQSEMANGNGQQTLTNGVNGTSTHDAVGDMVETVDEKPAKQEQNTISLPNGLSAVDAQTPQESESTFLDAAIDGTIRIWDRRVSTPIARIVPQRGTPPWCMGACWSPDGNTFWAGRRNGTVEEYSLHRGGKMGEPVRTLRFPAGSGAVSAVKAMPNGRGLICASYDILRLYDLKAEMNPTKHSAVPFLIVPGHRTGVISALHIDPTCRFMISAAGNRGWEGNSTEVMLGYEINIPTVTGL